MARSRNIKPGFFKNESLGMLEPLARILFAGLWCMADKEGRLEDRPKRIEIELLPYDRDANADALLQSLHDARLIQRYVVNGERYIQIIKWKKHQTPHHKEVESEIPSPDQADAQDQSKHESTSGQTCVNQIASCPTDSLNLIPDSLPKSAEPSARAPSSKAIRRNFERFYFAYPLKKDRSKAEKAFEKLRPDDAHTDRMIQAIADQMREREAKQARGEFVPEWKYPATWLSAGSWDDVITIPASPGEAKKNADGTPDFRRMSESHVNEWAKRLKVRDDGEQWPAWVRKVEQAYRERGNT